MKKKIFLGVFALALVAINVAQSFQGNSKGFSLEKLISIAFAESESEIICSRIKASCSCYTGNTWQAMSITECEDYEWSIPMVQDHCRTTTCPTGSSCR